MLTVSTLAPGNRLSTRRVWTSQTGVSTELTTFSTTVDPARPARVTGLMVDPSKWSRVKAGAGSPGRSTRPTTVSDCPSSSAPPTLSSIGRGAYRRDSTSLARR